MSKFTRRIDEVMKQIPHREKVTVSAVGGEEHREVDSVRIRKTPVMWGIPCDEVMFSKFFTVFTKNAHVMPWDGFAISEGTYLPKARNIIHNGFLESSNLPYLMMLDSDILFPPYMLNTLIAHNKPIIGGWYKNKKGTNHPVIYDKAEGVYFKHREVAGEGVERVAGMGAGCWLMHRSVAEKLGKDPYDMNENGEDLTLCRKLIELDIPLYVDWSLNLAHLGVQYV
jgi:hypothetical protein